MRLPAPLAALLTPRRFFAESAYGSSFAAAVVVVTAVAVLLALSVAGLGVLFASTVDGTVAVDNPDRPPSPFCESPNSDMHDGCDEPETIERDAGEMIWEMVVEFLPLIFVATYILWLVQGTVVHLLARAFGGEGRWTDTVAVLGWAMPAELLQAGGVLAFFAWLMAGETITAGSEAQLAAELEALLAAVPEFNILAVAVGLWQVAVAAFGLAEAHDVDPVGGAIASGLVVVPLSLFAAL
jgi:hypothetical protein